MELTRAKKNLSIIKVMFFVRYLGDSLFYGFFTRFIYTLNFSSYETGVLLAIMPLMAVLSNIFLAKLTGSRKVRKTLIFLWTFIEAGAICAMGFASQFYLVLILELICTFCSSSFYNLLDTFAIECTSKANKTFASLRIFGSSAYMVGTLLGGLLIKSITYTYDFMIGSILYVISVMIFFLIKFEDEEKQNEEETKVKIRDLFKIKHYIFYVIFIVLFLGINTCADNLFGGFTTELNIPDDIFGYFSSATIAAECLTLFIGSLFKSSKNYIKLMFSGLIALILRLVIFSIPNLNPYVYLSAQLLRGVTFGLYLSAHVVLLKKFVSPRYLSQAIFITSASQQCFSAILNQLSPIISEHLSFHYSFLIMLVLLCFAFIFLFLTKYQYGQYKVKEEYKNLKE